MEITGLETLSLEELKAEIIEQINVLEKAFKYTIKETGIKSSELNDYSALLRLCKEEDYICSFCKELYARMIIIRWNNIDVYVDLIKKYPILVDIDKIMFRLWLKDCDNLSILNNIVDKFIKQNNI